MYRGKIEFDLETRTVSIAEGKITLTPEDYATLDFNMKCGDMSAADYWANRILREVNSARTNSQVTPAG